MYSKVPGGIASNVTIWTDPQHPLEWAIALLAVVCTPSTWHVGWSSRAYPPLIVVTTYTTSLISTPFYINKGKQRICFLMWIQLPRPAATVSMWVQNFRNFSWRAAHFLNVTSSAKSVKCDHVMPFGSAWLSAQCQFEVAPLLEQLCFVLCH